MLVYLFGCLQSQTRLRAEPASLPWPSTADDLISRSFIASASYAAHAVMLVAGNRRRRADRPAALENIMAEETQYAHFYFNARMAGYYWRAKIIRCM